MSQKIKIWRSGDFTVKVEIMKNREKTEKMQSAPNNSKNLLDKTIDRKRNVKNVIADELIGLQQRINRIPKTLKEMLNRNSVQSFFSGIFGAKSKVGSFLTMLTISLAAKFPSLNENDISWTAFENHLKLAAQSSENQPFDLSEYIVAHRALGYGREKANSKDALIAAIKGGEKQIEIDLRRGCDGKIYLNHDSISHIKNPEKQFIKLTDVLEILAKDLHQDIVIFFDIKERGIVEEMDEIIARTDSRFKKRSDYAAIKDRHFVMGFDFEILKTARKLNRNRPLIFCYMPLDKLKSLARLMEKLGQKKMIGVCEVLDNFSGGHLASDLSKTCVRIDDKDLDETNENGENVLGIFTKLPPEEILKAVDYLCIPAVLASENLVKRIHEKGLNVAVWGASGKYIQEAIVQSGADLVISDNPFVK